MNEELVSIVVISYNSSLTILETLDSIKKQTYNNLELIITDDGSKDETEVKAKQWINDNKSRFSRCLFLRHDENTGIVANVKRGYAATNGIWIKCVAADDRLLPNCISDFVAFTSSHRCADAVFGRVICFNNDGCYQDNTYNIGILMSQKLSKTELAIAIYKFNPIAAPAAFIKRKSYFQVGGVDDSFRMIEDWPLWMKLVHNSKNLLFMDKNVVEYRISNSSVSHGNQLYRSQYTDDLLLAKKKANNYLHNMNIFSILYYLTYKRKTTGSMFWRLIHLINFLNPFYYQSKHVTKVFNWANNYSKGIQVL